MRAWPGWLVAATLTCATAAVSAGAPAAPARPEFGRVQASVPTRSVVDWVVRSRDNGELPFMVVDKPRARVYVFEADGRLRGTAPVLLGLARGDHTVPGIGDRPLAQIKRHERTTPAGRFVAERGRNLRGDDIIWVDYDSAVSMHRVRSVNAGEQRLERLATRTPADNRISYGCINVPAAFFDRVIDAVVQGPRVMVYVLPDVRALEDVFGWRAPGKEKARTPETGGAP